MRYACLLRGVNVSGRMINMRQLCDALENAGFRDVKSYLQSGNIIVESRLSPEGVSRRVMKAIADKFHFDDVDVVVLDAPKLGRIIAGCPEKPGAADGNKWYVTFLANIPADELLKALGGAEYTPDRYFAGKGVVYVYSVHYGRTKINNNFFERKLKVRATTRNWNTVTKLREMLE